MRPLACEAVSDAHVPDQADLLLAGDPSNCRPATQADFPRMDAAGGRYLFSARLPALDLPMQT